MEDVGKLKNLNYKEENQVTESVVEVASLTTDDDYKTLSRFNDESEQRVEENTSEELCLPYQMKRNLAITHEDFQRIMVTGIKVDPRYLIPLKDPNALGSKNWAKFAFAKLVEGVSSFQATRTGLVGGCILFLQLFYLDVVGNDICIYPKIEKPVMTWSRDDLKRVYEEVESEGGFKSENVRVTKKYFRGNVLSGTGSVDPSTGIKTTVVDDLSEVRYDVGAVKGDVEKCTVGELKANGLGGIVSEAIKQVFEVKSNNYGGNFWNDGLFSNQEHQGTEAEQHDDEMPHSKSIIVISTDKDAYGCDSSDMEEDEPGSFPAVSEISHSDSYLLTYLFSKKVTADDSVGSNEIVDISAAYLFDRGSDDWFMSTSFSVEGVIFFPIHDGVLKHWFLAVVKIPSWQCEIWDSNPENSANKRWEEYVAASIALFNSGDQRDPMALETVNHPKNEVLEQVLEINELKRAHKWKEELANVGGREDEIQREAQMSRNEEMELCRFN
ncbi:hypothetical protein ABKV19_013696 [Rosa sericea]